MPPGREDIAIIVAAFARAAERAKQAGFDAVQIHAAHDFLLSQFLSPAFNTRTNEYGGALKNRARFLLEVVRSIREAVVPRSHDAVSSLSGELVDGQVDGTEGEAGDLLPSRCLRLSWRNAFLRNTHRSSRALIGCVRRFPGRGHFRPHQK